MQPTLDWSDLLLRLGLTLCAGAIIGANRGEHGKPAGLRTTILVCLAASLAMLLANFLLHTTGRAKDSYVQIDVMRLPLGILTGMGFIGGGTILRRDNIVVGVTTAATLWLVTVIGLCFGAGQIALGSLATGLGFVVLCGLEIVKRHLPQMRQATLVLTSAGGASDPADLVARIKGAGYAVTIRSVSFTEAGRWCETRFDLQRLGSPRATEPPEFVSELARDAAILSLRWSPIVR
jgi:putative Mg2+ transporter-C (MgtC) family protein